MKIGIIGGGAIGLLISAYLAENHPVTLYTRSHEQANDLLYHGLHIEKDGKKSILPINARPFSNGSLEENDLLIIAVKQYQLHTIIPYLQKLKKKLLFVQNGMGHLPYLKELSASNEVFLGIVEHGAIRKSSYSVAHTGKGVIKVASYYGQLECLESLQVNNDFPLIFEENYLDMLTKKLIVNAMINPLTAVLGITNGELLINPHYQMLFDQLFNELASVLEFDNKMDMKTHVKEICEKTALNHSSMFRDIEEKRKTEIDSILGYILNIADKKNCHVPITKTLYLMVKGKEHHGKEN